MFFVAVCAFTWLEESTQQYGWEAKSAVVVLSAALIGNAGACFVLGAGVAAMHAEAEEKEEREREEMEMDGEGGRGERDNENDDERMDGLEARNQRGRMQPEAESSDFSSGFFGLGLSSGWEGETSTSPPLQRVASGDPSRRVQVRRQTQW